MKTCPSCRADAPDDAGACPSCGKPINQPDAVPTSQGEAPAAPGGSPTACPQCQAPLQAGAVLCIACGYDTRVGRRLSTLRGVEEAPPLQRPTTGLGPVRMGLALHAVRVFLLIVTIFVGLVLAVLALQVRVSAQNPPPPPPPKMSGDDASDVPAEAPPAAPDVAPFVAAVILSLIVIAFTVAQSVLGIVGSILCLWVPRNAKSRGWIIASLAFDVAAFLGTCAVLWSAWQGIASLDLGAAAVIAPAAVAVIDIPLRVACLPGLAAWILFMLFLRNLGYYLDRRDEAAQAVGIIAHGLIALFAFPLIVVPLLIVALTMLAGLDLLGLIFGYILAVGAGIAWLIYGIWVLFQIIGLINALRRELAPQP
jgi:hypothetical protein